MSVVSGWHAWALRAASILPVAPGRAIRCQPSFLLCRSTPQPCGLPEDSLAPSSPRAVAVHRLEHGSSGTASAKGFHSVRHTGHHKIRAEFTTRFPSLGWLHTWHSCCVVVYCTTKKRSFYFIYFKSKTEPKTASCYISSRLCYQDILLGCLILTHGSSNSSVKHGEI